jgi:hypothetical protein
MPGGLRGAAPSPPQRYHQISGTCLACSQPFSQGLPHLLFLTHPISHIISLSLIPSHSLMSRLLHRMESTSFPMVCQVSSSVASMWEGANDQLALLGSRGIKGKVSHGVECDTEWMCGKSKGLLS